MSVAEGANATAILEGELIDGAEVDGKHANGVFAAEKEAVKSDVLLVDVSAKHADESRVEEINGGEHVNGLNGHGAPLSASTDETNELEQINFTKPVNGDAVGEIPAEMDEASAVLESVNGDAHHGAVDETPVPEETTTESTHIDAYAEDAVVEHSAEVLAESEQPQGDEEVPADPENATVPSEDVTEAPVEVASADVPAVEETTEPVLTEAPEATPVTEEGAPTSLEEEATASEKVPVAEETSPVEETPAAEEAAPAVDEAFEEPSTADEQAPIVEEAVYSLAEEEGTKEDAALETAAATEPEPAEDAPIEEAPEPDPVTEAGVPVPEESEREEATPEPVEEAASKEKVEDVLPLDEESVVPIPDETSTETVIEIEAAPAPETEAEPIAEEGLALVAESDVIPLMDESSAIQTAIPESAPLAEEASSKEPASEEAVLVPIEEAELEAVEEDVSEPAEEAVSAPAEEVLEPAPVSEEGVALPEEPLAENTARQEVAPEPVEEATYVPIEEAPEPAPVTEEGVPVPEEAVVEPPASDEAEAAAVEEASVLEETVVELPVTEEAAPEPAEEAPESVLEEVDVQEEDVPAPVELALEPAAVTKEGLPVPDEPANEEAVPESAPVEAPEESAANEEAAPASKPVEVTEPLVAEEIPEAVLVTEEGVPVQTEEVLVEEVAAESAHEEPAAEEAISGELATEEHATEEVPSTTEETAPSEPVAEETATEGSAAEEVVVDAPAVGEPQTEVTIAEETVVEEPAQEQPVTEEPAAEESVVEAPAPEEPTIEDAAAEEPVSEEQGTIEPIVEEAVAMERATEEESVAEEAAPEPAEAATEETIVQEAAPEPETATVDEAQQASLEEVEVPSTLKEEPVVPVLDETSAETTFETEATYQPEAEPVAEEESHASVVAESVVVRLMDESSTIQTTFSEEEKPVDEVEIISTDADAQCPAEDDKTPGADAEAPAAETEVPVDVAIAEFETAIGESAIAIADEVSTPEAVPVEPEEPAAGELTVEAESTVNINLEPKVEPTNVESVTDVETVGEVEPSTESETATSESEAAESASTETPVIQIDAAASEEDMKSTAVASVVPETGSMTPQELDEERPKSPWTPSYSVTIQGGAGTGVADNDEELAELSQLPPPAEIEVTEDQAQSEPQITITEPQGDLAAEEERLAVQGEPTDEPSAESQEADTRALSPVPDDVQEERPKSPWTPSYSVTTVGSGLQESEIAAQEQEIEQLEQLPPTAVTKEPSSEVPEAIASFDAQMDDGVPAGEEPPPSSEVQGDDVSHNAADAKVPSENEAVPVADVTLIEEDLVSEDKEESPEEEPMVQPEVSSPSLVSWIALDSVGQIPPLAVDTSASEGPKSLWTPSYSVTRTPELTAETLPTDEPVTQPPTVVLPVVDSSVPERPKSPWTASYSVTRSPDLRASVEPIVDEPVIQAESADTLPVAQDSDTPERPKSPWTPSYSVTRQGSGLTPAEEGELSQLEQLPERVLSEASQQDEPAAEQSAIPTIITEEVPPSDTVAEKSAEIHSGPVATGASITSSETDVAGDTFTTEALDSLQKSTGVGAVLVKAPEEPFPSAEDKAFGATLGPIDEDKVADGTSSTFLEPGTDSTSRARHESTTSSRFFPGGWFSSAPTSPQEGRASLDSAQGEFTTRPTVSAAEDAEKIEEEKKRKGRWCIIM
ncbi:hypothetical protein NEOLEDRAFT_1171378 [Neolentinus lepideus HHB14362 ss-1]|uniref:Uncharacterized protein n=1 Tax=Neolentinus lepideus HHB14362 ss-1 TaxID=1314782 RepID=A0A165QFI1_9AGAM|nr:hypothetical protein NEOLEDRAFT_1171378 [Neolentinus lepideus HHB14362 ss-1]